MSDPSRERQSSLKDYGISGFDLIPLAQRSDRLPFLVFAGNVAEVTELLKDEGVGRYFKSKVKLQEMCWLIAREKNDNTMKSALRPYVDSDLRKRLRHEEKHSKELNAKKKQLRVSAISGTHRPYKYQTKDPKGLVKDVDYLRFCVKMFPAYLEMTNPELVDMCLASPGFKRYLASNDAYRQKCVVLPRGLRAKRIMSLLMEIKPKPDPEIEALVQCVNGTLLTMVKEGNLESVIELLSYTHVKDYLTLKPSLQLKCWMIAYNRGDVDMLNVLWPYVDHILSILLFPLERGDSVREKIAQEDIYFFAYGELYNLKYILEGFQAKLKEGYNHNHQPEDMVPDTMILNQFFICYLLSNKKYLDECLRMPMSEYLNVCLKYIALAYERDDPDYVKAAKNVRDELPLYLEMDFNNVEPFGTLWDRENKRSK